MDTLGCWAGLMAADGISQSEYRGVILQLGTEGGWGWSGLVRVCTDR